MTFTDDAKLENVVDFKKWGAEWHDIGRGIAMAHGLSPQDIRVVGATNGSIVIELAVVYGVAKTVSAILLEGLKVADRVLDIRMKTEQLREMKLSNEKIVRELEAEGEKEKGEAIAKIVEATCKQLGLNKNGDGDKVSALEKAIQKLVGFIEKGGELDAVVPEGADPGDGATEEAKQQFSQIKQLRGAFQEVRVLESKIKQLENKLDEPSR